MFGVGQQVRNQGARSKFGTVATIDSQRKTAWSYGLPAQFKLPNERDIPWIVAVGGGKGGVGKSLVSANLAGKLAQSGLRILVVDMDLGCSNLHTHMGIANPAKSIADMSIHRSRTFSDLILPTQIPGVGFVAGGREEEWAEMLDSKKFDSGEIWQGMISTKNEFNVDIIVLDMGAGAHGHTMEFFTAAHLGMITVLPEPTSIENAYVFIKSAIWKMTESVGARLGMQEAAADTKGAFAKVSVSAGGQAYLDCLRKLSAIYPDFIQHLWKAFIARRLGIVINQVRNMSDAEIGKSMEQISTRYFGVPSHFLGYLNYDDAVWKTLRNRRLLIADFPHCLISKRMDMIAARTLDTMIT